MADKEKLIIKIIQQPAELPCSDCKKDCRGDAFMRCKKLKTYNKKITAKEYDYDKAIDVMAEAMYYENYDRKELPVAFIEQYKGTQRYWKKRAETGIKSLLGRYK